MTPDQKLLVRNTWEKVHPNSEQAAVLFYNHLFEQYPEVKPYFKGNITEQGQKLIAMINTAVNGLDNLEALIGPLQQMGARHADYGVKEGDYEKMGSTLLWTLEKVLGTSFTPKVEKSWTLMYDSVANAMKDGAAKA